MPEGCPQTPRYRSHGRQAHDDRGRNSRTQTLLSICQRQQESSTSSRERCSTRRRFSVARTWRRSSSRDFGRRTRTCSGSRTSVICSRESDVPISDTFIQPTVRRVLQNRAHDTPQKKKATPLSDGYVISPPSHFDETTEIPRGTSSRLYRRVNRMAFSPVQPRTTNSGARQRKHVQRAKLTS